MTDGGRRQFAALVVANLAATWVTVGVGLLGRRWLAAEGVGGCGLGDAAYSVLTAFTSSAAGAFAALAAARAGAGASLGPVARQGVRGMGAVAVGLLLVAPFGGPLGRGLATLGGGEPGVAGCCAAYLPWLLAAVALDGLRSVASGILFMTGRPRAAFVASACGACAGLVALAVAPRGWGVAAVGVARLAAAGGGMSVAMGLLWRALRTAEPPTASGPVRGLPVGVAVAQGAFGVAGACVPLILQTRAEAVGGGAAFAAAWGVYSLLFTAAACAAATQSLFGRAWDRCPRTAFAWLRFGACVGGCTSLALFLAGALAAPACVAVAAPGLDRATQARAAASFARLCWLYLPADVLTNFGPVPGLARRRVVPLAVGRMGLVLGVFVASRLTADVGDLVAALGGVAAGYVGYLGVLVAVTWVNVVAPPPGYATLRRGVRAAASMLRRVA